MQEQKQLHHVCVAILTLDMSKLRSIGTDGAATMVGCCTGVVTRLQPIQPSVIGVHCAAHRPNLASSQAGDNVQYIKHLKSILRQHFDFFETVKYVWQGWMRLRNCWGRKEGFKPLLLHAGSVLSTV